MGAAAPLAGKREQTKVQNRAAILDAGREVFAELGYDAASVRDIVRRTDLASGTFYNYYSDKEAVLQDLLDESAWRLRHQVRTARREAPSVEAFVADAYSAFFRFLAEDRTMLALLRRNAGTIRALFDDPILGAGVDELLEDLRAAIAERALPSFDAEYMAAAMAAAGFEIGIRMVERDPIDVDGAAAFARDLFLGGIARLGVVAAE
jgi:AcrR family transcriptional regulator